MPSIADLKTDQERAAAIREALRFALTRACDVLNQGEALGLRTNFHLGPKSDTDKTVVIHEIDVVKIL